MRGFQTIKCFDLAATIERFRFFNESFGLACPRRRASHLPHGRECCTPWLRKSLRKTTAVWIRPITHLSKSYFALDLLQTARATAAFRFHLNIAPGHRKIHTSIDFQVTSLPARAGKAIGIMSSTDLKERFPELVDAAAEYK
jgi:hypothetical protein